MHFNQEYEKKEGFLLDTNYLFRLFEELHRDFIYSPVKTQIIVLSLSLENFGQLPEWPNGADCNSAGLRLRWFESITAHGFDLMT